MTHNEFQAFLAKLEAEVSKDNASFGIYQYGGGADESYIRANKDGLKLFALELLKGAAQADDTIPTEEKNIIPLPYDDKWVDEQSDIFIQYVKPINEGLEEINKTNYKEGFVEKLVPVGCFIALAIILLAIIVGLWTLLKWAF